MDAPLAFGTVHLLAEALAGRIEEPEVVGLVRAHERRAEGGQVDALDPLLQLMVSAGEDVSPFDPDRGEVFERQRSITDAHRSAAVLLARFWPDLDAPFEPTGHGICWPDSTFDDGCYEEYDCIYGDGQFTWAGVRSGPLADEPLRSRLLDAWEADPGTPMHPIVASDDAQVFEITSFEDWVHLIGLSDGVPTPTGRRPDWAKLAESFDAVHLRWSGFLLAHDHEVAARRRGVITLTHWGSSRTLWLRPSFELVS